MRFCIDHQPHVAACHFQPNFRLIMSVMLLVCNSEDGQLESTSCNRFCFCTSYCYSTNSMQRAGESCQCTMQRDLHIVDSILLWQLEIHHGLILRNTPMPSWGSANIIFSLMGNSYSFCCSSSNNSRLKLENTKCTTMRTMLSTGYKITSTG